MYCSYHDTHAFMKLGVYFGSLISVQPLVDSGEAVIFGDVNLPRPDYRPGLIKALKVVSSSLNVTCRDIES